MPLASIQDSYWFKFLSVKRRKMVCVLFQNITQLTGGGRTIFLWWIELVADKKEVCVMERAEYL
jgi:hypothetical protein